MTASTVARSQRRRLPESGERVGPYEVVAPVAQGGMAEVFLVRRRGLGGFERRLAMKVMHPHLAGDTAFVNMFLDEARIASSIDHANVVKVLDVGTQDELPWLVMEWLDGKSLAEVLTHRDRLSISLRANILADVATGLHGAHEARSADGALLDVVHRDVSPQNVHIGYDGVVKLVDFGIAAAAGRLTRTETGQVKGKIGYLAPEQIVTPDEPVTRAVDVWAFGVMAWETLAVRRLFGGSDASAKMYQIVHSTVPPLAQAAPDVPPEITALVMQCLERDPARRPANMSEIARTLKQTAGDLHAREAIALHMTRTFGADRDALEARIEAIRSAAPVSQERIRQAEPSDRQQAESSDSESAPTRASRPAKHRARADDVQEAPTSRPRRRVWPWVTGATVLLAIGAGSAWAMGSRARPGAEPTPADAAPAPPTALTQEREGSSPEPARPAVLPAATPPPETTTAETATASTRTIELAVARGVRTVSVDGVAHAERPLRIELTEGGVADVELVGADGRHVHRAVRASDDGMVLALPRRIWSSPYD